MYDYYGRGRSSNENATYGSDGFDRRHFGGRELCQVRFQATWITRLDSIRPRKPVRFRLLESLMFSLANPRSTLDGISPRNRRPDGERQRSYGTIPANVLLVPTRRLGEMAFPSGVHCE